MSDKDFGVVMFSVLAAYLAFSATALHSMAQVEQERSKERYCRELGKKLTGHNIVKYEWVCNESRR